MDRWTRFLVLGALFLGLVAPVVGHAQASEDPAVGPADARPNILLILTDDQSASPDGLSVMPNVRRIFGEGGRNYQNAVVTTPLCCPSRASIFSGKYVHNHNVVVNDPAPLDMSQTIQAELSDAGYRTALVGKFFNEWFTAPPYFDQWAMQMRPASKTYYDARFNVGGDLLDIPDHSTNYTEEQAIGFLNGFEADDSRPWFMQISPYAPHPPATPEPEHAFAPVPAWERNPAVKDDLRDKPPWVQDVWSNRRAARSLRLNQLRSLMGVDDMVGNVFDTLNELNERDTLAIFMSDNGFMWLEHGLTGKRAAYNESVRIPFFVRWPEHIMGGTKSTKIIGNIDVAPTVYEATGIQPSYQLDGRSIWEPRRSEILLEHLDPASQQVPLWRSIWRPDRQYIESGSSYETREYYGPTDPWQTRNLFGNATVGDEPADAEALAARVAEYAACAGETCP